MRKYFTNLVMVMVIGLLFMVSTCEANRYDFIKTDVGTQNYVNLYNQHIKTAPVIINYLNAMVDSPTTFYMELVDQDCDKEVLNFVKKNKSLALVLTQVYIMSHLSRMNVQDNELMFVTNWVTSPEAILASTGERNQSNMLLQNASSYLVYQMYTKPGGFKTQTEELFQRFLNAYNNR